MKTALPLAALSLLALTACGGGGGSEAQNNSAQQLEDAAEVSNPAAAQVLDNAAEGGANGVDAQSALQQAGNVQAGLPAGNGESASGGNAQ